MSNRARKFGWGAVGFLAAFLIFVGVAALWGIHIDRLGQAVIVHRPAAKGPSSIPPRPHPVRRQGGDALQPAPTAGQQPMPVPAGETGGSKPPRGGGGGEQAPPKSGDNEPPMQSSPDSTPAPQPAAVPTPTEQVEPDPADSLPSAESEDPGLLTPVLTKVCSLTDHLASLC